MMTRAGLGTQYDDHRNWVAEAASASLRVGRRTVAPENATQRGEHKGTSHELIEPYRSQARKVVDEQLELVGQCRLGEPIVAGYRRLHRNRYVARVGPRDSERVRHTFWMMVM